MSVLSREADNSMLGLGAGQRMRDCGHGSIPRSAIHLPDCSFEILSCVFQIFANVLLEGGGQGGNPAAVALKGAAENQLLGHDGGRVAELDIGLGRTRGVCVSQRSILAETTR